MPTITRRGLLTSAMLITAPLAQLARAQELGAFDVGAYGAAGDGKKLDTGLIWGRGLNLRMPQPVDGAPRIRLREVDGFSIDGTGALLDRQLNEVDRREL